MNIVFIMFMIYQSRDFVLPKCCQNEHVRALGEEIKMMSGYRKSNPLRRDNSKRIIRNKSTPKSKLNPLFGLELPTRAISVDARP